MTLPSEFRMMSGSQACDMACEIPREDADGAMARIFCMIPTWNEAENIGPLLDALLAVSPEIEPLVVDDNSPDGTWEIVAERAESDPRVHLLHRTSGKGRGRAGIAGFKEALRLGADAIIEMDADWSHDPKWIPDFVAASRDADVVIGSRLIPGGGEAGRSPLRRWITLGANLYIRTVLGLKVKDATTGYRLFSRACAAELPWDSMRAEGPETVQEILLAAASRGFTIREIPILFVERRFGESTFNSRIMIRSLFQMWRLRLRPGALVPAEKRRPDAVPAPLALPASWLYRMGRSADRALQLARRKRLPAPVICVGNLSVGGTGKSPFVRMLAEWLVAEQRRPGVLSRGYGAAVQPVKPLVVSDGTGPAVGPGRAGDEPADLARRTRGVSVVIHPNRWLSGRMALKMLHADTLVLDDGFQHDRLARDADLVLWDLRDEPGAMRALPAGRLREGLGALKRATAIVLTHGEYLGETRREAQTRLVIEQIKFRAPRVPIFEARTAFDGAEAIGDPNETFAPDPPPWRGQKIVAVTGLASPGGFETMLKDDGAEIVKHFAYPDHFAYGPAQAGEWRTALNETGAAWIVTTTKDAVKIGELELDGLPICAAPVKMQVTEPERWEIFLRNVIERAGRKA